MKLASIEVLKEVRPHPGADRLDLVTVLGFQCITRRGEFSTNELAVFVQPDTILPRTPWSEFLVDPDKPDKPIRLRTVKLRGEFSQGLLLPLSVLPESVRSWQVGADVGGILGVTKFEKEVPAQLMGEMLGKFPEYLAPITDEDNGLANPDLVRVTLAAPIVITQKLDGSSCTIICENGDITHVCSRRIDLKENAANSFWQAAIRMRPSLKESRFTGVIQGELMGPGIQGNQLGLLEPALYLFQVRDGEDGGWLPHHEVEEFAHLHGANSCWALSQFDSPLQKVSFYQEVADFCRLPNGKPAEGIVVRRLRPITMGSGRPMGFKLINRNYKDA